MTFNVIVLLFSTGAAVVSAICAYLTFRFSRKLSTQEKLDILKAEILRVVSPLETRKKWRETVNKSYYDSGNIAADVNDLAELLGPDYQGSEWVKLLPAAIIELKDEQYGGLLGMSHIDVRVGTE